MRFVLKTQPYEKPIAAGSFRYEQEGVSLDIVEHWSLNHALDGYKFFRVDVDGRNLKTDGYSTLYNVVLSPDGQPENVKFRHFTTAPIAADNGLKVKGQIVFDDGLIYVSREISDMRYEDEFAVSLGLGLPVAARWLQEVTEPVEATSDKMLTLNDKDQFQPSMIETRTEVLETAENGYPTKVQLPNGTIAVSTRLTIYR